MTYDRAVMDYCIEEFGRLVAQLNRPDASVERAALELALATLRDRFAAAENDAVCDLGAHARAHYYAHARVLFFLPSTQDRALTQSVQCKCGSGTDYLNTMG